MQCSSTSNLHGFKFKIFRGWGAKNYWNNWRCHPGKHKKANHLGCLFSMVSFLIQTGQAVEREALVSLSPAVNSNWILKGLETVSSCFVSKYTHLLTVQWTRNFQYYNIAQLLFYWEKDNLCSLLDSGRKIFCWSKLTMPSLRVQPWVRGRNAGSFPEQRLVIEPISFMASTTTTASKLSIKYLASL